MQNHLYLLDSNFEIRRSLFAIVQGAVPATYFIVFSFLPVSQSSAVGSWSIQNVVQMASILLMFISLFVCVVLLITHHRISVIGTTIYHSLRRSSNVVGPVRWSGVSIIFFVLSVSTFHLGLFGWMLAEGARLLEYVIIAVVDPIITVVIIIAVQASANQNKIDSLYSGQETEHDVSRVANDLNNHAGLSLRNTVRDIYVVLVLSLAMYVATLAAIGQVGAIQMAGQLPLTDGAYNDWLVLVLIYGVVVQMLSSLMLLRLRLAYEEFVFYLPSRTIPVNRHYWSRRALDRTFLLALVTLFMCIHMQYLLFELVLNAYIGAVVCLFSVVLYIRHYIIKTKKAFRLEQTK